MSHWLRGSLAGIDAKMSRAVDLQRRNSEERLSRGYGFYIGYVSPLINKTFTCQHATATHCPLLPVDCLLLAYTWFLPLESLHEIIPRMRFCSRDCSSKTIVELWLFAARLYALGHGSRGAYQRRWRNLRRSCTGGPPHQHSL